MPDPDEHSYHPRLRPNGSVQWLEETIVEVPARPRPKGGGSVLGAAMIAVGEIIEPEKTRVELTIEIEAPSEKFDDLPFAVEFGDLPELS